MFELTGFCLVGYDIPILGLGVYQNDECYPACMDALKLGYRCASFFSVMIKHSRYPRHIDSARYYKNEKEVGRAVRACGLPRDHVFVSEWYFQNHRAKFDDYKAQRNLPGNGPNGPIASEHSMSRHLE